MKIFQPRVLALALFAAVAALPARAETLDIGIGDDSVRAGLAGPLSSLFGEARGEYDVGVLVNSEQEDDLVQAHVGVLISGDAGAQGVDVAAGLGVRGLFMSVDSETGGAVALGGRFEARLPDFNRLGLIGEAYYAPSATSFGEIDEYREFAASIDYQVVPNAAIFVGYRNINYDIHNVSDVTVESGFRAGLRLTF